ncbi:MAG: radical SAM protein [Planctomycetes bacterium]|nr:radical SAM protein [Planctomycetota bacterium]
MKYRVGPSGLHIFDRQTGINLLFDEVRARQSQWAAAPRQVSVAVTNACDLACPYCYAPKTSATLDFDSVVEWLEELDANGCLGVGFGGGEPTVYPRFAELCRKIAHETALAVTFTTHAHRLNNELASALAGNVHFVRVSMDGVGDTYESLRSRSFSSLCLRLELVRQIACFGINFVVNSQTLADLDAATEFAAEIGALEFLLLPEQPTWGRTGIDENTALALRHWVSNYRGSVPLTVSTAGAAGLPTSNPLPNETGLRAYAHIDASGILKTSSFENAGVAIGVDGVMRALEVLRTRVEENE